MNNRSIIEKFHDFSKYLCRDIDMKLRSYHLFYVLYTHYFLRPKKLYDLIN